MPVVIKSGGGAVVFHEAAHGMQAQMAAEEFAMRQDGAIDRIIASTPSAVRRSSSQRYVAVTTA